MLKPQIAQLLNECDSPYSLVVTIAKRSRDIAQEALDNKVILEDKPVNMAIDEFGDHKFKIVEHYSEKENF